MSRPMPGQLCKLVLLCALALSPACPCGKGEVKRPYPTPTVDMLIEHVQQNGQLIQSYMAESTMDYWVGDERIKATVYVMGTRGTRIRLNALNPATNTTAADLACNDQGYVFLDYEKDCQLRGVCDRYAIAQLLRVRLEPDDFLLLAVGSTPVVSEPTGKSRWDEKRGAEILELVEKATGRRQTLVLSGKQGQWDVLESTMYDAQGNVEWKLQNKDFRSVETEDGKTIRVPGASRFEQPGEKSDLAVRWDSRTLNLDLDESKFQLEVDPGIQMCPSQAQPAQPAAGTEPPAPDQAP